MIIDFRVTVPAGERSVAGPGAAYMSNYGRIYGNRREEGAPARTAESMVNALHSAGIQRAVLQAEWMAGDYRDINRAMHTMVERYPETFVGYCTVNPNDSDDISRVVEEEVRDRGARGVNLNVFSYNMTGADRRLFPLYATCERLNVPVTVHSSINFSNDRPIEYGRPLHLCDVACAFPNLTIIANHGGWPWVAEMVAVAWKHRNVYVELGGVSPKYIGMPGGGWETLIQFGNSVIQDQVLFATDNMLPYDRVVTELQDLPLKDSVKEKWLGGNAARILDEA